MKKIRLKPWMEYVLVFILLLGVKATLGRLFPSDDPEGGNLLVNGPLPFCLLLVILWPTAACAKTVNIKKKYNED